MDRYPLSVPRLVCIGAACLAVAVSAAFATGLARRRPAEPPPATAASRAPVSPPAQPDLVQPESLEQGFILVVTDKLGVATGDSPIYIASNHNGWNPADDAQKLTPRSDRRWQIVFPKPRLDSRLAFKFTRGSWDNVEVDAKFGDVENRSLPKVDAAGLAPGQVPIIELSIEAFKDRRPASMTSGANDPYREINATGTTRRVEVVGGGVPITRDLIVWLPPGYDDPASAARRYPVLYLNDGQNIFEQPPGVPGEWHADETATKLIADNQIEPLIIVGIPNAGASRAAEYLPAPMLDGVAANGDLYVEFLVTQVVPRIERAFRVREDAASRAIGGSSLGAVISLYAASRRPDVFGGVLAESTSISIRGASLLPTFESVTRWPSRVYLGVGTQERHDRPADSEENRGYVQATRELNTIIEKNRAGNWTCRLVVDEGATHTESAWARRLPAALRYLFPPSP